MKRIYLVILLLLEFSVFVLCANADINNGLVAHYLFDGNANDESGNGYDCIPHGNPNYVDGLGGQAVYTTQDYFTITPAPQIISNFSISFWMNTDVTTGEYGEGHTIYTTQPYGDWRGFGIRQDAKHIAVFINKGSQSERHLFESANFIGKNNWHFVAVTYDGSSVKVFHDGNATPVLSENFSGLLPNNEKAVLFRHYTTENEQYFEGRIDDLRVYDRNLSVSEIQELYKKNILYYDDGEIDISVSPYSAESGSQIAVRFSPSIYPIKINSLLFYVAGYAEPATEFEARIYTNDGGLPGTRLDSGGLRGIGVPNMGSWVEIDATDQNIVITEGDFFVSMDWLTAPGTDGLGAQQLGLDNDDPIQGDACWKWGENDVWNLLESSQSGYGNPMIRVLAISDTTAITSIKFDNSSLEYLHKNLYSHYWGLDDISHSFDLKIIVANKKIALKDSQGSIKVKFSRSDETIPAFEEKPTIVGDDFIDKSTSEYLEYYKGVWSQGEHTLNISIEFSSPMTYWIEIEFILKNKIQDKYKIKIVSVFPKAASPYICDHKDIDCRIKNESIELNDLEKGIVRFVTNYGYGHGTGFIIKNNNKGSEKVYLLSAAHVLFYNRDPNVDPGIDCTDGECPTPDRIDQIDFNLQDNCGESATWQENMDSFKPEIKIIAAQLKKICLPISGCTWQGGSDWVLLSIPKLGSLIQYSQLKLNNQSPNEGDDFFIIHHPSGSSKKLSFAVKSFYAKEFDMAAEDYENIEPGSSGAPVLIKNNYGVIGVVTQENPPLSCAKKGKFTKTDDIYEIIEKYINPTIVIQDGFCDVVPLCTFSIQSALKQAYDNTDINVQSGYFNEDLYFDEDKLLTIIGGYSEDLTNIEGETSVDSLSIFKGTLKLMDGILVLGGGTL